MFVSIMQSALDSRRTEIPLRCMCKLIMCDISVKSLHRCVFLGKFRRSGGTGIFWALSPLSLRILSRGEKMHLVYELNFPISTFAPATFKLCINHSAS